MAHTRHDNRLFALETDALVHVLSYLDRESVLEAVRSAPWHRHALSEFYCLRHGNRLEKVVSDLEKEDDKTVLQMLIHAVETLWKDVARSPNVPRWLSKSSFLCEDCEQAKLGNIRCPSCNNFDRHEHVKECDECGIEGCSNIECPDCVNQKCSGCEKDFCEHCFHMWTTTCYTNPTHYICDEGCRTLCGSCGDDVCRGGDGEKQSNSDYCSRYCADCDEYVCFECRQLNCISCGVQFDSCTCTWDDCTCKKCDYFFCSRCIEAHSHICNGQRN